MSEALRLNLIHLFTFYLAAVFLVSTMRRLRQYHDVAQLVFAAQGRWPRVVRQMKQHWIVFLTWTTLRPAALAIGLRSRTVLCSLIPRMHWIASPEKSDPHD